MATEDCEHKPNCECAGCRAFRDYQPSKSFNTIYSQISLGDIHKAKLSIDAAERKGLPIARGVLDYFPLAIAEIAKVSKAGNEQHNAGQPMHWAREKSTDHADCIVRHLIERGSIDSDGQRHSAKMAWRALALLQIELEGEGK